jgi:predicted acyl esterase
MRRYPNRLLVGAATTLVALASIGAGTAVAAEPAPFGHACTAENGVRFCPSKTPAERVPSFDGVPIDVDVTLPETGSGPFPTIVMMHGFGGSKTDFETTSPEGPAPEEAGNGSTLYHYNNVFFAKRGYAVVNYSARGFGESCGGGSTGDHEGACAAGYIRLADSRFDARDAQYLLGVLADEGIVKPRDIGATGVSYGGGESLELAFLAGRVAKPDGKLTPWRSPDGKQMRIAAAYPRWPWSDLISALVPNGRFLNGKVSPFEQSLQPFGIPISSYLSGLYLTGVLDGYYCGGAPASSPCTDAEANITQDKTWIEAGQPLPAEAKAALTALYKFHGGYPLRFVKGAETPAPLLIESGWTDELFPVEQSLRVYTYLRSQDPTAPVSLLLGDLGHSRGSDKPGPNHNFNNQAARFFAHYLQGAHKQGPAPGSVTAYKTTCPAGAAAGKPTKVAAWNELARGRFAFGGGGPQTFTSAGGSTEIAREFDPTFGTTEACKTIPVTPEPNTATYTKKVAKGFTMMGMPTVSARISSTGRYGQIDARLWDISPEGTQLLVNRGVYALEPAQSGQIKFQLHGNGYYFAPGHTVELQLLGRDAPYYQASSSTFTVHASEVKVELPTRQSEPR